MPYNLRRKSKHPSRLTPEEDDVQTALAFYTDEEGKADLRDFVPTRILWETYEAWINQFVRTPEDPATLTRRQFGAALARVFPELEDRSRRVKRTYEGRVEWGYVGLKGPRSIRSHEHSGRPSKHVNNDQTAAPAPKVLSWKAGS
jgi:hypothetical protein